jgi:ADP-heptose:LPS heptosyltransferase
MSNVLIIKHGSLGDLIQANGAMKDIKENFPHSKIILLTTLLYAELMSHCPYIDGILIDKRLPRWNVFYLTKLKKTLKRFNFNKIFDLQNSSRTKFYRRFFFKNTYWSSSEISLKKGEKKSEFDKLPVLDRMKLQLENSGLSISFTLKPDLSWIVKDTKNLLNQNFDGEYILLFPFCSEKLKKKKWPYYKDLIHLLKRTYGNKYNIAVVPGPNEIEEAGKFKIHVILDNNKAVNLLDLVGLIKNSSYVISNDTGPAHIAAHLDKKGLVLFGSHTTAKEVSIETKDFKSIQVKSLNNLKVSSVLEKVKENLN